MEIRLGKTHNKLSDKEIKIEFLDSLTTNQFKELENAISEIEELNNIRRLLEFVIKNDNEIITFLNSALQELVSKSVSWDGVKRTDADKTFFESNRLLLNYLSSVNIFLCHCETYLNRKFGDNSETFIEFKKMLSVFYDNSFAYRFLYQLRNYSQHCGLPLDNIQFTSEFDRDNNRIKGTLKITFNRDKLLANYKKWKTVKSDLEKMDNEFEVTPLLFEMTHNIEEIERNIEILHKDGLVKAAKYIIDLTKHLQDDKCEIFVAYDFKTKENGELDKYHTIHIPFDTINFIQQTFSFGEK